VRLEVERSCKRLGVERLDLVQVHARDPRVPVAETMGALAELRAEGRLREIGVSNYSVEEICEARRALGEVPLASDQPEYSLLSRGIERELLPVAREDGIGLLVYSPLAQGLLTGKVRADRRFRPGEGRAERNEFQLENRRRVNELLDRVVAPVAERLGATLGQVALAWVAAQPGVTAALVSARTPDQARENAAAGDLKLEPEEIRRIGEAFARLELVQPGGWRTRIRAWLRKLHGGR
jgi:aryl-alcohol dehydrogenase-like predicted oxidoreductase